MKKRINLSFIKNLVESDFFLIKSFIKENFSKSVKTSITPNKFNTIVSLELFQLTKSLKQLIRILQFLNNKKEKHLYFDVESHQLNLINKLILELDLESIFTTRSEFFYKKDFKISLKRRKIVRPAQLLLTFKSTIPDNFLNRFIENNVFLINTINSINVQKNIGTYKMYNEFSDFKKLIFLIVLINKVVKLKK